MFFMLFDVDEICKLFGVCVRDKAVYSWPCVNTGVSNNRPIAVFW